jgi:hypothetical protein
MATKQIYFDHNGQTACAYLLYNFQDFTNLLLVIPKEDIKDFNCVIPFMRINKIWETVSPIKYGIPGTIKNISNELNKVFNIEVKQEFEL